MSAREAAVKLTLDGAQFSVSIKKVGDAVEKTAERGKRSMSVFGAGIGAARKSMNDLGGAVKRTLGMALTFGGAFSVGTAIKGAVELQSTYTRLAFRIQTATGAMTRGVDVQQIIERSAARTSRTNEEMAATFGDIFEATGDLDFSRGVLDSIGTAASATGADLSVLTTLADQLHTKFGVTADGMLGMFAKVNELSGQGGPKMSEFADVMGTVGSELLAAGLSGERGLNFMLGALNETDDAFGDLGKQVKGMRMMLRGLGDTADIKSLAKKLSIDPKVFLNEKDALARVRKVLSMGKRGIDALEGGMKEGEEKLALKTLFTDPFEAALLSAQASGLKGQAAIDSALLVFDARIGSFGKSVATAGTLQEQAAKQAQTPAAQLTAALNTLSTAFSQPAIISAVNELAKQLPKLASVLGSVVEWAAQNPILATSIGLAAKGGAAAIPAMGGALLKTILGAGSGAAAAGGAGAVGAGAAAGSAGVFGVGAGAVGVAAVALPAAILAALAAGGLIVGEQISNAYQNEGDILKELASATAAGTSGGSTAELKAALERLMKANTATTQGLRSGDIGGGATDYLARMVTDAPDTRDMATQQLRDSRDVIDKLQATIAKREAAQPAPAVAAAAVSVVAKPLQLDPSGPKMIGVATATALGGMVLDVRIRNAHEVGGSRASAGPGGSRGPMVTPQSAPGGGH